MRLAFALLCLGAADYKKIDLSALHWTLTSSSSGPLDNKGEISIPATVPGDINAAIVDAGILPDYWVQNNSQEVPWWVPIRTWTYHTTFDFDLGAAATLSFEGCDYNCTFTLNGNSLGRHYGSFVPFVVEVERYLQLTNKMTVTIHSPPHKLIDPLYNGTAAHPTQMYGIDQCMENEIWPMWKSRLNMWDFAPKTWQAGLWRGGSLRQHGKPAALDQLPVVFPRLSAPYSTAELEVRAKWKPTVAGAAFTVRWQVTCLTNSSAPSINTTSTITAASSSTWLSFGVNLTLREPSLWWPNGYGQQHRYKLAISLQDGQSQSLIDSTSATFGVRDLQNLINSDLPGRDWWMYAQYSIGCGPCLLNSSDYEGATGASAARGYPDKRRWLFSVNGRNVFARGGNWVPGDMFFGKLVRDTRRFRAILAAARATGYTFMRVWGGGLIEDRQFYDLCDEFGIMLQQDFPLAGCGFGKQNKTGGNEGAVSFDWLSRPTSVDGLSVLSAQKLQIPIILSQLANHPSVVRYTSANEFYMNRTYCPYERQYEDLARGFDDTRMTREADPTNVGQRHGPYTFSIVDGSGYDAWGGRWDAVGACASVNFDAPECCGNYSAPARNLTSSGLPGCRYAGNFPKAGPVSGPGDPFEWSEFGTTALSDAETLRYVMTPQSLEPSQVGVDPLWTTHGESSPGMWLAEGVWAPVFCANRSSGDCAARGFPDLETIVRASQWAQWEGYRFAYQAARRRKWLRSLMASWTFNEPWPNTAHGCIIDYYGRPKMALYGVRQALAMVDVSLAYSDIWQQAGEQIRAEVWIDSELAVALENVSVEVEYFTPDGTNVTDGESFTGVDVRPSSNANVGRLALSPPNGMVGNVLITRVTLISSLASSSHDYHFSIIKGEPKDVTVGPLRPLLTLSPTSLEVWWSCVGASCSGFVDVSALAPAFFVKPMLLDAAGKVLGHAIFSRAYFTIRPCDGPAHLQLVETALGMAEQFCAEAWNAKRICVRV